MTSQFGELVMSQFEGAVMSQFGELVMSQFEGLVM